MRAKSIMLMLILLTALCGLSVNLSVAQKPAADQKASVESGATELAKRLIAAIAKEDVSAAQACWIDGPMFEKIAANLPDKKPSKQETTNELKKIEGRVKNVAAYLPKLFAELKELGLDAKSIEVTKVDFELKVFQGVAGAESLEIFAKDKNGNTLLFESGFAMAGNDRWYFNEEPRQGKVIVAGKTQELKTSAKPSASIAAKSDAAEALIPKELLEKFKVAWPKNKIINVVFHGHSVPAGYYVTPDVRPFEAYPHLVYKGLKEKYPLLQMNCIVTAIGGETSPKGAARFEKDVLTHKPDIIFIDYNVNDRRVKEDAVRKAWSSMIEMAQKEKIPVVLLTPTGIIDAKYDDPTEPLNVRAAIVRELAAKYHCSLADVLKKWKAKIDSGVEPKSLLSNDINHPNLVGHQLAADVIMELVKASDK